MNAKNIVSVVLLLFVAASVVYLIAGERGPGTESNKAGPTETSATTTSAQPGIETPSETAVTSAQASDAPATAEEQAAPQHKLIAYYFHRTQRCSTCLKMEAYAEDALRAGFPEAFTSGELEWRAVNIELPKNEHFIQEYELAASALVMAWFENGEQKQWRDLGRVWELVGEELEFKAYVEGEALAFLE
jgi:hypothetical protein